MRSYQSNDFVDYPRVLLEMFSVLAGTPLPISLLVTSCSEWIACDLAMDVPYTVSLKSTSKGVLPVFGPMAPRRRPDVNNGLHQAVT